MNILTHNKEMKEKIKKLLNNKKSLEKPNKIELEIELEKKYGNREEYKSIVENLVKVIFNCPISIDKLLKAEKFLLEESTEEFFKKNIFEDLNKTIKEDYKDAKDIHRVLKFMYIGVLIIVILSFFGHYNNWTYSFWNKNIFLLIFNVIIAILSVIIIIITYSVLSDLNKYNKRYNLKRNNFFEISLGITLLIIGAMHFYFKSFGNIGYSSEYKEVPSYSQSQAQQEEVKPTVVENNNVNTYIPTVEDARYVNYKTYYNDNFDYSIDYPDNEYFQISKTYEDGMKLQNDNGEVLISLTSNWNPNGESLQQAYDKAVREKPNAAYKFLGKTFFTITYEDNGLLIFRKTMYDKNTNKYVYLYVSFPPEYKDYMTPIVERMANSMKKSSSTQSNTNTSNVTYNNYYNSYYRYSMDYPTSSDFYISSNTNDGMVIKSNDENVYISVIYGYDEYGDNLQTAYNRAVSEYPNAPYKFLGKTFFTITYEENGLLVFRKTVYDKANNGYIYLYVSFPPEYKEYMSPIVEKMANTMKKR